MYNELFLPAQVDDVNDRHWLFQCGHKDDAADLNKLFVNHRDWFLGPEVSVYKNVAHN